MIKLKFNNIDILIVTISFICILIISNEFNLSASCSLAFNLLYIIIVGLLTRISRK